MQKISELREQIKDQNNVITKLMHKLETTKNTVHTAENQITSIERKLKISECTQKKNARVESN